MADSRFEENIHAAESVLEEIDAQEIPTLYVMNKIDLLEDFTQELIEMKKTR